MKVGGQRKLTVPSKVQLFQQTCAKLLFEVICSYSAKPNMYLLVPLQLGYGARGSAPEIPPHAVLQFDIKLLAVK